MNKKTLALLALILFTVIAVGLIWLAIQSDNAVSALLSYAAGLSMIFLPCTLPLALVIMPIAAREKEAGKGLGLAIAFALGLVLTITIYGIVTSLLGGYFGLDQFTRAMFIVAGIMALLFGLTELDLFHIPLPTFTHKVPNWISKGYSKSFLLGMFLGNAGIGCPNPAFYVLLTYIASSGSVVVGGWLGLVHGLGRATPLIFLAVLAILGFKATDKLSSISKNIGKWTGFALIFVGAFILTYGLFGMHWWEDSIIHAGWNQVVLDIAPNLAEAPDHPVTEGVWSGPSWMGWWSLVLLTLIPIVWYKLKHGMNKVKFWLVTLILMLIGVSASVGWITVEHGHGEEESDHSIEYQVEKKLVINQ